MTNTLIQALELHKSGEIAEAINLYEIDLLSYPENSHLLYLLGTAYAGINKYKKSKDLLKKSLSINPENFEAHLNLGVALKNLGETNEALKCFDNALRINSESSDALLNRGNALKSVERNREAIESYQEALIKSGSNTALMNKLGVAFRSLNRFDDALICYERALDINPNYIEVMANLGNLYMDLNRYEDATRSYEKALSLSPSNHEIRYNYSQILLLLGKYEEGWLNYEERLYGDNRSSKFSIGNATPWRGEKGIKGKRILIHLEQGLGDIIQFCRYIPYLEQFGAKIILLVPNALKSLMDSMCSPMQIITSLKDLPDYDLYCPVMSLPFVFNTRLETIPAEIPYLYPNKKKVENWENKLGRSDRMRVGLVWSGSTIHKNDKNRSIQLEKLVPLLRLPIDFHSLQKEYRNHELEILNSHPKMQQHQDDLYDFSDTAALIECMDLVISVDTSVAHVAGAIGKPVWIMLPFSPDYRWMLDREDSPWYPTAKLFRQQKGGDWESVIESVQKSLGMLLQVN